MHLSDKEKRDLLPELRKMYRICKENGYKPSALFAKLGETLKSEVQARSNDNDTLYHGQTRSEIDEWLEAIESNIENENSGGTHYSDKEKQFVEDMRGRFHEKSDWSKPLTGGQVAWLKKIYERS